MGFIPGMQGWYDIHINKCNTSHKQKEIQKSQDHINRCRKTFDKVQHPFMIKMFSKVGVEGAYLNIIRHRRPW